MPLTDTAIRSAKPKDKTFKLFDGGGLYLEVNPSGGKWFLTSLDYVGIGYGGGGGNRTPVRKCSIRYDYMLSH